MVLFNTWLIDWLHLVHDPCKILCNRIMVCMITLFMACVKYVNTRHLLHDYIIILDIGYLIHEYLAVGNVNTICYSWYIVHSFNTQYMECLDDDLILDTYGYDYFENMMPWSIMVTLDNLNIECPSNTCIHRLKNYLLILVYPDKQASTWY